MSATGAVGSRIHASGKSVLICETPILFSITYYVGLSASIVALASRESTALLTATVLLSTSPVYAYLVLKLTEHYASAASGAPRAQWAGEPRGRSSELLSEGCALERNGAEALDGHPEA